jgi:hypothetical protein
MIGFARTALAVLLSVIPTLAADVPTVESTRAKDDVRLTLDPAADFWKKAHPVFIDKDRFGNPVHAYRSEVRTRWTKDNLYFLFICPYKELSLKPNPNTHDETNELWNWEVAEAFIGSDFSDIQRALERPLGLLVLLLLGIRQAEVIVHVPDLRMVRTEDGHRDREGALEEAQRAVENLYARWQELDAKRSGAP